MNDFKNNIIQKIKTGEVRMQPRWHFVFRTLLLIVGTAITALLAIYFLSFILFALRKTGLVFAPQMGFPGITFFITASPWLLVALVLIFLFLLYVLVTHFTFSYRRPLIYSLLVVTLLVVGCSSLVQHTTMHERIQSFTERNNTPAMAPFYHRHANTRPDGMTLGTITEITPSGFLLQTEEDRPIAISVIEGTRTPPGLPLEVGMHVLVFGEEEADTVTAFGVKPVPEDFVPPSSKSRGGHREKEERISMPEKSQRP